MKNKRVLICPLDWGLGHATRCVPVIRQLLYKNVEVVLACDGKTESLLKKEFPSLKYLQLTGYCIRYSKSLPMWLMMLIQGPKIIFGAVREHRWLKKIVFEENIGAVISDNRFGLWNRKIKTVYITHQIAIKAPKVLKVFFYTIHQWLISKYSACWIPDFAGEENLSGDLAHQYPLPANAKYIGPLSRLKYVLPANYIYDVAIIISGVEPHRTILEKKIAKQLQVHAIKAIVVSGEPSKNNTETIGSVKFVSHLPSDELEKVIAASKLVICRSGYSGIMDLIEMKKNAILIPTPGQTEQEYLAKELMRKGIFYSTSQDKFNLQDAIEESKKYSVEKFKAEKGNEISLSQAIDDLIDYE